MIYDCKRERENDEDGDGERMMGGSGECGIL